MEIRELKNIKSEIKKSLDVINSRFDSAEERNREVESSKIIPTEALRKEENEWSLDNL